MKLKTSEILTQYNSTRQPQLVLTCSGNIQQEVEELKASAKDRGYSVEIKPWRERRSLDANAYFHVLVDKIAKIMKLGSDETKVRLVLEYGTIMRDENGEKVGIKLPVSVDVNKVYKYAKWFDERMENDHKFNCYIIYEHTHNMDTKQMTRLIDGTVYEAKELGIETMTPEQLSIMKNEWGK